MPHKMCIRHPAPRVADVKVYKGLTFATSISSKLHLDKVLQENSKLTKKKLQIMELQARLPLSVLLLSVVFVGLSASPVPINLLSRLRRSASTTTGTTLESSVPTTEESLSTVSASPSARVVRQARSADSLSMHYNLLHTEVHVVSREHQELYSNYKRERFGNDTDPIVRDMGLSYLPSVHDLAHEIVRSSLPDSELVTVHYNNLIIFRDTLARVRDSETRNVSERVDAVIRPLRLVINRLETTMILNGQEDSIIHVESSIPEFHSDVTIQERNMRTLFVLQEFHEYMPHVMHDYKKLAHRHQ
ncbi:uncharacterized protein LOC119734491 [Patiria miniata]|uniref:Transmembrane protein n=1 Tax=Patiria miniata TaxID=46514 RepID=A0A914AK57_PATMI|nr:uncharacterized protein LOC119734491 [Patiria miniata]